MRAVQEELLSDQKNQFHEVYGSKDELAETIWSWRNADDLQNKLDEVSRLQWLLQLERS